MNETCCCLFWAVLSLPVQHALSSCGEKGPRCGGYTRGLSCRYTGFSGCDSQALTCGFSSWWCMDVCCSIGYFPDQALDRVSALVGGFLSIVPPGKINAGLQVQI